MKFSEHVRRIPIAVRETFEKRQKFKPLGKMKGRVYVVGSGSSYSQAIYFAQLLNNTTPYTAIYLNPYSFVRHTEVTSEDVFIHLTQEAKRNDNICPTKFAIERGMRTILFTSKPDVDLAREIDEVYWFAPEIEKILVAAMSYVSGYAVIMGYVNAQLRFLERKEIGFDLAELERSMIGAEKSKFILGNEFTVFLFAGYAQSVAVEGALKVNECYLMDAEAYELKHYSHGKHFVSWNRPRIFNILYHETDQDLVDLYRGTIFEKHHKVNLMKSALPRELAVFDWSVQMLTFVTQGMALNKIELEDIPIRNQIRIPHQFVY